MPQMPPSQRISFDRGFQTLFEDGVHLLLASEREKDNDTANSLARGSIACTMMLLRVADTRYDDHLGGMSQSKKESTHGKKTR